MAKKRKWGRVLAFGAITAALGGIAAYKQMCIRDSPQPQLPQGIECGRVKEHPKKRGGGAW